MDKRVIENQMTIDSIIRNYSDKNAEEAIVTLLADISRSLAVIADTQYGYTHPGGEEEDKNCPEPEEVEKTCRNCRFWTMDFVDPERRCSYCHELDEWEAKDGSFT